MTVKFIAGSSDMKPSFSYYSCSIANQGYSILLNNDTVMLKISAAQCWQVLLFCLNITTAGNYAEFVTKQHWKWIDFILYFPPEDAGRKI